VEVNLKFVLSNSLILAAQDFTLTSPGKVNRINVYISQQIEYEVLHREVLVLERSPLSITINGNELGISPRARKPQKRSVNQTISPIVKVKRALIQDHFTELEIPFRGGYSVVFRAYDDGVAYRMKTSLKNDVVVDNELIVYNFPQITKLLFL